MKPTNKKEKQITITEFDEKTQIIDTKITDAREVLRILVTTIGSFIVTLSEQNPGQQEQLTKVVHDTLDNIISAGFKAKSVKDLN